MGERSIIPHGLEVDQLHQRIRVLLRLQPVSDMLLRIGDLLSNYAILLLFVLGLPDRLDHFSQVSGQHHWCLLVIEKEVHCSRMALNYQNEL